MSHYVCQTNRQNGKMKGLDKSWCLHTVKNLLDAHYDCDRPGPDTAREDVEWMLANGFTKIILEHEKTPKEVYPAQAERGRSVERVYERSSACDARATTTAVPVGT